MTVVVITSGPRRVICHRCGDELSYDVEDIRDPIGWTGQPMWPYVVCPTCGGCVVTVGLRLLADPPAEADDE